MPTRAAVRRGRLKLDSTDKRGATHETRRRYSSGQAFHVSRSASRPFQRARRARAHIDTAPAERRPPARPLCTSPNQKRRFGNRRSIARFPRWWKCEDAPGKRLCLAWSSREQRSDGARTSVRRGVGERRRYWNFAGASERCSRSCGINPAPPPRSWLGR